MFPSAPLPHQAASGVLAEDAVREVRVALRRLRNTLQCAPTHTHARTRTRNDPICPRLRALRGAIQPGAAPRPPRRSPAPAPHTHARNMPARRAHHAPSCLTRARSLAPPFSLSVFVFFPRGVDKAIVLPAAGAPRQLTPALRALGASRDCEAVAATIRAAADAAGGAKGAKGLPSAEGRALSLALAAVAERHAAGTVAAARALASRRTQRALAALSAAADAPVSRKLAARPATDGAARALLHAVVNLFAHDAWELDDLNGDDAFVFAPLPGKLRKSSSSLMAASAVAARRVAARRLPWEHALRVAARRCETLHSLRKAIREAR
jgi:CHAD domain-containing protein